MSQMLWDLQKSRGLAETNLASGLLQVICHLNFFSPLAVLGPLRQCFSDLGVHTYLLAILLKC